MDISVREKVQLIPRQMMVANAYGPPFAVTCMALEEILAEGKVKGEELVEIYELERLHEIKEGEKHATSN